MFFLYAFSLTIPELTTVTTSSLSVGPLAPRQVVTGTDDTGAAETDSGLEEPTAAATATDSIPTDAALSSAEAAATSVVDGFSSA